MAYDSNVLRRATQRLTEERERRESERDLRRAEIYQKLPQAAQIDRQLSRTILDIIAASLRRGDDPAPAIEEVRRSNQALQARRAELLRQNGYPDDALDERPACAKCGDTGWVGAHMCDCLKKLCAEEQIRELSKLLDLGEQSFDSFSLDYYSDNPWPGEVESPGPGWSSSGMCVTAMPAASPSSSTGTSSSPGPPGWARPFSLPVSPGRWPSGATPSSMTRR